MHDDLGMLEIDFESLTSLIQVCDSQKQAQIW
jgi:hypothetical protein